MVEKVFEVLKRSVVGIDTLLKNPSTAYLQSHNSSGDIQLQVDVQADRLLEDNLLALACVKGVCSEEKQEVVYKESTQNLIVAYDPLDGSSLVDSNLSVGSIFGIYQEKLAARNLIASAYALYGPRLELVLAYKKVLHFRYCGGEWVEIGELRLKNSGKINAPGGTQANWESKHKTMVDSLFARGYRLRYSGGMVPDLHQILVKGGGLFSYPATSDAKNGKLRKLFEVFPFAFIYELSGGCASDGERRLLDLEVEHIHDTTPCFFGSNDEMAFLKSMYTGGK